jgi:hypothetical protein
MRLILFKNIIKPVIYCFVVISSFLFISKSGTYRSVPIEVESQDLIPAFKDEGIFAKATAYTPEESLKYLRCNLLAKGVQPIQLSIQNNTSKPLGLGDLSIDLPLVSGNHVATQFYLETLPRTFALKAASFFFWPFLIPSTIDGVITYKSQKKMRHDYTAKTIKNYEEIVPPYSTINRILFVKHRDMRDTFTLTLQDKETGFLHTYKLDIA